MFISLPFSHTLPTLMAVALMQINRNGELEYVEIRMLILIGHQGANTNYSVSSFLRTGNVPLFVSLILWEGSVSFP